MTHCFNDTLPVKWVDEVAEIWEKVNLIASDKLLVDWDVRFGDVKCVMGDVKIEDEYNIMPKDWVDEVTEILVVVNLLEINKLLDSTNNLWVLICKE